MFEAISRYGYAAVFVLGQVLPGDNWWSGFAVETMAFFLVQIAVFFIGSSLLSRERCCDGLALPDAFISLAMSLCLAYAAVFPSEASGLNASLAVLQGAGMAWIRMQWFGFFGCIALIDAVRYVFGSVVAGSTISLALFLAPEPVSSALVATLPLVSFALSRGAKKRIGHSGAKKPVSRVDLLLMIRSVLVFVLACSFMAGIANVGDSVKGNVGGAAGMSLAYLAMALASLLIIYMVVECKKVPSVSILWKSVLVYILVYFFGVDILANVAWGFEVLNGSLLVVRSIAVSAMMVLLANVCLYLKQNPYFVFSAGFSIWSLGVSGSTLLCMMIMDNSVLSAATALAVMLVVILVPQVKDFGETRLLGDLTRKNALMVDMRRKCAAIAKRYKLSPREEEVMEYMCKGRSRPYIAEAMMLSENTIASHAKNIYTKIGVHSKQELIDMVESILEDG